MARRQGFGRQLVQGLLAAAWELGARQAYLQVGTDNTAARNLYRQLGPISFAGKTLEELGEMFSERISRLRVGAMESTAAVRLLGPLAEYHHRYPGVALDLSTGPTLPLLARVLSGDLDAAFVADPAESDRLDSVKASTEELVLVAEAGHTKIRSPKDLRNPNMLAFGGGCTYRRVLEHWFSSGGVDPHRVVELSSYHAILGCAVAGAYSGHRDHHRYVYKCCLIELVFNDPQ